MTTTEEAIARTLAVAPPLSDWQIKRLKGLLNTATPYVEPTPEPRPETEEERNRRFGEELNLKLSVCAVCAQEAERHKFIEHYGYTSHRHVPLSPAERLAVMNRFMSDLAEVEGSC